jgi:hypothetical protein
MHAYVVEAGVVLLGILSVLIIEFESASRSQHVPVAHKAAQSIGSGLLDIVAGYKWRKDAPHAETRILPAFLGLTRHRHKGQ